MVREVPGGSLFLETGEKYITVKYLRTAVGLPGTDSSGIDVERSNKCKVQESDPDCQLPSAFHFHRGCLWYGNELLWMESSTRSLQHSVLIRSSLWYYPNGSVPYLPHPVSGRPVAGLPLFICLL